MSSKWRFEGAEEAKNDSAPETLGLLQSILTELSTTLLRATRNVVPTLKKEGGKNYFYNKMPVSDLSSITRLVAGSEGKGRKYTWHILWQVFIRGDWPNGLPEMGKRWSITWGKRNQPHIPGIQQDVRYWDSWDRTWITRSLVLCTEIRFERKSCRQHTEREYETGEHPMNLLEDHPWAQCNLITVLATVAEISEIHWWNLLMFSHVRPAKAAFKIRQEGYL